METERDVRHTAERVAAATEDKIESTVDAARDSIVGAIKPARQTVQSFAERQKQLGAEQIGSVARATHRAAEEMEKELPGVAQSIHGAAGRLEAASETLRNQRFEDLLESLGDIARKRPAAVFGGAILAGFALSRFLKASTTQR